MASRTASNREKRRIRTIQERHGKDAFKKWGQAGGTALWRRLREKLGVV